MLLQIMRLRSPTDAHTFLVEALRRSCCFLFITCIILLSAISLYKAASRILLRAVSAGMSVDDIKEGIEQLPGVLSCHHLHVWQLSDTKLVASLHIQVEWGVKNESSGRYMHLARQVRRSLHEYGIYSSAI